MELPMVPADPGTVDRWMRQVSREERARILSFRHWADRVRTLGSALLIRHVIATAGRIPPSDVQVHRTSNGRPYLAREATGISDFNVSHHGSWVGCTTVTIGRVGLDIVQPSEFQLPLMANILSPSEWKYVRGVTDHLRQQIVLANLWAAKEAYLKMLGVGLSVEPDKVAFDMEAWDSGQIRLDASGAVTRTEHFFKPISWTTDVRGVVCTDTLCSTPLPQIVPWDTVVARGSYES